MANELNNQNEDPITQQMVVPPEVDQLLTDYDPQSAVAAQGWKPLVNAVGQNLKQQWEEAGERIHRAAQGDKQALFDLGQQAAMSTVGSTGEENIPLWQKEGIQIKVKPTSQGYQIRAFTPDVLEEASKYKYPENYLEGKHVGHLNLKFNRDTKTMSEPGVVSVEPQHRRKGIATAMYQAAEDAEKARVAKALEYYNNHPEEKAMGVTPYKIVPSKNLLEKGKLLWEKPNRLFGYSFGGGVEHFADGGDIIPPEVDQLLSASKPEARQPASIFSQKESDIKSGNEEEQEVPSEVDQLLYGEKYGTPSQLLKTGVEGALEGAIGPLAPALERAIGVSPEEMLMRRKINPGTFYGSEGLAFAAPALLTGGASVLGRIAPEAALALKSAAGALEGVTQVGLLSKTTKALEGAGLVAGNTLASKIGTVAAKQAIDNALIASSDEISKLILNDPDQSVGSAVASVGLSSLLGGTVGGTFAAVSPAWKKASSSRAAQELKNFVGRFNEHIMNPNPVGAITEEFTNLYQNIKKVPVFGEEGIKSQAIEKLLPNQINDAIATQISDNITRIENSLNTDLVNDPNKHLLEKALADYRSSLNTDQPSEMFKATQKIKQQFQEWGKYHKDFVPLSERAFRDTAKDLAFEFRQGLENPKVWGEAGNIQAKVNKAFSEYFPTLQDIEKTFTRKLSDGTREFDPGKINTYYNQLGKPTAEIKQSMVKEFLDKTAKYQGAIDDAFLSVGMESPFEPVSLNQIKDTLNEKTLGAKIADIFIHKGLKNAGGEGLAGVVGSLALSHVGIPKEIGFLVGSRALGRFFTSVLGTLGNSLISNPVSAKGFKAASEYITTVSHGEELLNHAVKGIFHSELETLPLAFSPSKEKLQFLDNALKKLQTNLNPLLSQDDPMSHYLPAQQSAVTFSKSNASQYLNSIRADQSKQQPLDDEPEVSQAQKDQFNSALRIAEQPLTVLESLKNGTLTAEELRHLQWMYPAYYKRVQEKVTNAMIDHLHQNDQKSQIPYQTKIGLSMLLAQPLDSTMTPSSILAAQPKSNTMSQNVIQNQPTDHLPSRKVSGRRPSAPALQKMPHLYQTFNQSRDRSRQK